MNEALEVVLDGARLGLRSAARNYVERSDGPSWEQLAKSAEAYARARWALVAPAPASRPKSSATVPFGRDKGKSVSDVDDKSIRWLLGVCRENLEDPTKERYRAQNSALLEAVETEAAARGL